MRAFDYFEPDTLEKAVELLDREPGLLPLAGGTNAIIDLREGRVETERVIWLGRLHDLKHIRMNEGTLRIGALVTLRDLLRDPLVSERLPVLAGAARQLGSPAVRNLATIGGNLAQASPAADMAPPLLALGAELRLVSVRGERVVALDGFFRGPQETVLRPDELLAEILVPASPARTGSHFVKAGRRKALAIALASAAAVVTLDESGSLCEEIRVAMGSVAPTPVRLRSVEQALRGTNLSPEALARAAEACERDIAPITDGRARAWYRAAVAPVLVRRAVGIAAAAARSGRATPSSDCAATGRPG